MHHSPSLVNAALQGPTSRHYRPNKTLGAQNPHLIHEQTPTSTLQPVYRGASAENYHNQHRKVRVEQGYPRYSEPFGAFDQLEPKCLPHAIGVKAPQKIYKGPFTSLVPRTAQFERHETNGRYFVPSSGILDIKSKTYTHHGISHASSNKAREAPYIKTVSDEQATSISHLEHQAKNLVNNWHTNNSSGYPNYNAELSASHRQHDGKELEQATGDESLDEDQGYLSDSGIYRGKSAKPNSHYPLMAQDPVKDIQGPALVDSDYMATLSQDWKYSNFDTPDTGTSIHQELHKGLLAPMGSDEALISQPPQNEIYSGLNFIENSPYEYRIQNITAKDYPEVYVTGANTGVIPAYTNVNVVTSGTPNHQLLPEATVAVPQATTASASRSGRKRKRDEAALEESSKEVRKEYDYLKDARAPSRDLAFGSGPHTLVEIIT